MLLFYHLLINSLYSSHVWVLTQAMNQPCRTALCAKGQNHLWLFHLPFTSVLCKDVPITDKPQNYDLSKILRKFCKLQVSAKFKSVYSSNTSLVTDCLLASLSVSFCEHFVRCGWEVLDAFSYVSVCLIFLCLSFILFNI